MRLIKLIPGLVCRGQLDVSVPPPEDILSSPKKIAQRGGTAELHSQ